MKLSFLILFLSVSSLELLAQGNNSPYSILGLGDLDDNYYNRTSGFANTGIAYRSDRFLINNNPASFSALDNQLFTAELGIRGTFIDYKGTPVDPASSQSGDITFRRLVLGMKVSKHWGTSFGLMPYSTQNYEFSSPITLQGTAGELGYSYYQGHGSINKVYWANAYEFLHHISVGVNASYLFGQLSQKEIIQGPNLNTLASTTNNTNLSNLFLDYGLQVFGKIGKRWDYSIGGTFSHRADLYAQYTQTVLGPDSSTLYDKNLGEGYLSLPNTYGIGISVSKDKKYTFLADYKYQGWGSLNSPGYTGNNYQLENSQKLSAGFEISKKKTYYNTRIEKSYFQAGAYFGNSYLAVNGQRIRDIGGTVGFGINSLKSPLAYSIVFQYGVRGNQKNDLVEQRYANITFAISFREAWYTRGRKYD